MPNFKMDLETAEAEFEQWTESWEIDTDTATMEEQDYDDFRTSQRRIINIIRRGRFEFNQEEDCVYYTTKATGEKLRIEQPAGDGYINTDKYKEGKNVHKNHAVFAQMTNRPPAYFTNKANISGIDYKALMSIQSLFLGS